MKVLITGASSYVGARLYLDLLEKYQVVGTYFSNALSSRFVRLNLTEKLAVIELFGRIKPDIVVHVANYPSPKSAVNNESNFIALNQDATQYVVDAANSIGAKVVFISSQAACNPDNIYGKLKVASERLIKSVREGYLILRPSLIIGMSPNMKSDRTFNRILKCLEKKSTLGKVAFDTSWKLQPTYIGHLSQVIDYCIRNNSWNKVVPVFINEVTTQYQIARDILENFNVKVDQVNQGIMIPLSTDDLREFESIKSDPKTYSAMIEVVIGEIRQRQGFIL